MRTETDSGIIVGSLLALRESSILTVIELCSFAFRVDQFAWRPELAGGSAGNTAMFPDKFQNLFVVLHQGMQNQPVPVRRYPAVAVDVWEENISVKF